MPHTVLASALRELRDVARAATPTHRRLRDHLTAVALATIGVDAICAVLAFVLERGTSESEISTFRSAGRRSTPSATERDGPAANP
jgi:hypothetical protein